MCRKATHQRQHTTHQCVERQHTVERHRRKAQKDTNVKSYCRKATFYGVLPFFLRCVAFLWDIVLDFTLGFHNIQQKGNTPQFNIQQKGNTVGVLKGVAMNYGVLPFYRVLPFYTAMCYRKATHPSIERQHTGIERQHTVWIISYIYTPYMNESRTELRCVAFLWDIVLDFTLVCSAVCCSVLQ